MLFGYVIKEMSAEELREYLCEVQRREETVNDLIYTQRHLIDALHKVLDNEEWYREAAVKYEAEGRELRFCERKIEERYKDVSQGSVCYCEPMVAEQTEPSNRIVEKQPTPIRNFMVNQTEPSTDCGWK